ncbi:MAG: 4'-phosphopantetheinyl transferase superfamily protein [Candidatus Gracilibacteria bacterium]|nr:4'-phosphopantetheinyl transferase superfamily protein [Candidatus Gracilibacteria bacterium]
MILKIIDNLDVYYKDAIDYFPQEYSSIISSKESLISRYIISTIVDNSFNIKKYLPELDSMGKPVYFYENLYWSISHKENLIFVGVSDDKIGIDVEIYKERDQSILDYFLDGEYELLGGKNWANFYVLWTAKESVIKYNLLDLDEINSIKLLEVISNEQIISDLKISKKLLFNYKNNINQVFFGENDGKIYSICIL